MERKYFANAKSLVIIVVWLYVDYESNQDVFYEYR